MHVKEHFIIIIIFINYFISKESKFFPFREDLISEGEKSILTVLSCLHPIMKTYLYNFDPLKPHFYKVKLGLTGGIHYFSYFCSKT